MNYRRVYETYLELTSGMIFDDDLFKETHKMNLTGLNISFDFSDDTVEVWIDPTGNEIVIGMQRMDTGGSVASYSRGPEPAEVLRKHYISAAERVKTAAYEKIKFVLEALGAGENSLADEQDLDLEDFRK